MQKNSLGQVMALLACIAPESQLRLLLGLALAVEVNSIPEALKHLIANQQLASKHDRDQIKRGVDILLDLIVADGEFSATERGHYIALIDRLGQRRRGRWGISVDVLKSATLNNLDKGVEIDTKTKQQLYGFVGVDKVEQELKRLKEIKTLDIQNNTLGKTIAFLACIPPEGQLRLLLELALAIGVRETQDPKFGRIRGVRDLERLRRLPCNRLERYVQRFAALSDDKGCVEKSLDILLDLIAADGWLSDEEDSHLKAFSDRIVQDESLNQQLRNMMGEIGRVEDSTVARTSAKEVLKQVGFFEQVEQELTRLGSVE